jgi:hypothetical protein
LRYTTYAVTRFLVVLLIILVVLAIHLSARRKAKKAKKSAAKAFLAGSDVETAEHSTPTRSASRPDNAKQYQRLDDWDHHDEPGPLMPG